MANTVLSAKNIFNEGLVMDFAPDNTQSDILTSALNATLITFNGNEMSLQNDMGNGRVETARLPEGYIPVGTCEFGDIIYIVSYNPLNNKAQIGCFPSPERNITSTEISDVTQILLSSDFQEMNGDSPTGTLKKTSIKKVLIGSKKLNPGDKYIIYTDENNSISGNSGVLSDYGKKEHDVFPQVVKLHVVSIEDSGKITYLDTTTKWYDNYYIKEGRVEIQEGKTDLDSYRDLVSSEWSIFSSKVPGKLSILAELETIDSFSCSYLLEGHDIIEEENIKYKQYNLFLEPYIYGKSGVVSPYIIITDGKFSWEDPDSKNYVSYKDSNNNDYKTKSTDFIANKNSGFPTLNNGQYINDIKTEINFKIPYKDSNKSLIQSDSFIYNFDVVPTIGLVNGNAYGRLDHLKVGLSIDFNKVGTGDVDFYTWKYHNSTDTSILTYGINPYPKPGFSVQFVQIDFYDNQGQVAQYILDDRKSYNGIFSEYINLDSQSPNIRISKYKINVDPGSSGWNTNKRPSEQNNIIINHKGEEVRQDSEEGQKITEEQKTNKGTFNSDDYHSNNNGLVTGTDKDGNAVYYRNDAGILYSNALYAAEITVWYSNGKKDLWESKSFLRWYWTNSMFNEYYYNTKDFDTLNFELIFDSKAVFATNSEYIWKNKKIDNLKEPFIDGEQYKTYSSDIQYMEGNADNLDMYVQAGLQNDYGCFNLNGNNLNNIQTSIYLSQAQIDYTTPENQYEFSDNDSSMTEPIFMNLESQKITDNSEVNFKYLIEPINTIDIKDNGLKDQFNIHFSKTYDSSQEYEKVVESIKQDDDTDIVCEILNTTLDKCYYANDNKKESIKLRMDSILHNKAYTQNTYSSNIQVPVYSPIIDSEDDFNNMGLSVMWETNSSSESKYHRDDDGQIKMGFSTGMNLSQWASNFSGANFRKSGLTFVGSTVERPSDTRTYSQNSGIIETYSNTGFLQNVWGPISDSMGKFFMVYPGGDRSVEKYGITGEGLYDYPDIGQWIRKHYGVWSIQAGDNSVFSYQWAYDISGGTFSNLNYTNKVGFLGIKYKNGFTLLNQAFVDYHYGGTNDGFMQASRMVGTNTFSEYENFAYHLYLILSNTFHKNKRLKDKEINLRNYVRNSRYTTTFTKNIIVKLFIEDQKNLDRNTIYIKQIPFGKYVESTLKCISNSDDLNKSRNVTLKLLDSAVNNTLTIQVKSRPFEFINIEADAYLYYNGELIPTFNLADNVFYIYQNGELIQFQNKQLKFNIKSVSDNIKYLFGNTIVELQTYNDIIKLRGVHPPKVDVPTQLQEAYNEFCGEVYRVKEDMKNNGLLTDSSIGFNSSNEVNSYIHRVLNSIMDNIPSTIKGYTKNELYNHAKSMPTEGQLYPEIIYLGAFNSLFYIAQSSNLLTWEVRILYEDTMERISDQQDASEYSFNTQFNLQSLFSYENNSLIVKDNVVYSTFGIKDDPVKSNYAMAYGGFIKDVIIDTNFQIVP